MFLSESNDDIVHVGEEKDVLADLSFSFMIIFWLSWFSGLTTMTISSWKTTTKHGLDTSEPPSWIPKGWHVPARPSSSVLWSRLLMPLVVVSMAPSLRFCERRKSLKITSLCFFQTRRSNCGAQSSETSRTCGWRRETYISRPSAARHFARCQEDFCNCQVWTASTHRLSCGLRFDTLDVLFCQYLYTCTSVYIWISCMYVICTYQ